MARLTPTQWNNLKARWQAGESKTALAEAYGTTYNTVRRHEKAEGWVRDEQPVKMEAEVITVEGDKMTFEPVEPETTTGSTGTAIPEGFEEFPTIDDSELNIPTITVLEQKLADAEEKLAAAEAELTETRPTMNIDLYSTPDEVMDFIGKDEMYERAADAENAERVSRSFVPIEYSKQDPRLESRVVALARELVARRSSFIDRTIKARTVKMAMPDKNYDKVDPVTHAVIKGYRLVQPQVEKHLNNEAGQPGASMFKQRDKGAKLILPYRCQTMNCWLLAKQEDGEFVYGGYCSVACQAGDPYSNVPDPAAGTSMASLSRGPTL